MRRCLLVAWMLGGALPLAAQSSAVSRFGDEVVVTASVEEEERRDLPASVTVVTEEEIEARLATEVLEVLATVPGLTVARSGSPGHATSLFSRGVSSDQTLVLWNGVVLNDAFFGGFDWGVLPTQGVERVEVVRGPFSSLYGGSAIGGVVQVFTGRRDGGDLRLEVGDDGYRRASVAAGHRAGDLRFDVAAHLRRGDGRFANDFFDGEEMVARLDWALRPGITLGLLARANDSEVGIPFSGGSATPERRQATRSREVALPFQAERGRWRFETLLSRASSELGFRDPLDPFFTRSETEAERLRGRGVASFRFRRDSWLALGGEWEEQRVTDSSNLGTNLDGESRESHALFAQLFHSWWRWRFDLGLRQDEDRFYGGQLSPRLGVVVELGERWRLRAGYGEGFRAPSLGELFFPFFGNPALEPERSESYELGVSYETASWTLAVTGFDTRLRELIDADPLTFQAVNVGRARSRGVELDAGWRRDGTSLRFNATLLSAEDLDLGLDLLRRPAHSASVVATARPGAWVLNLTGRFVGERPDVDPATFQRVDNPAYLVVDLAARRRVSERLAPYLRVLNAADRAYEEVRGFPAPRRALVGGVAVAF